MDFISRQALINKLSSFLQFLKMKTTDFIQRHLFFFGCLVAWIFLWMFVIAPLATIGHVLFFPVYALSLIFSLGFLIFGVLRPVVVFLWTGPVALAILIAIGGVLGVTFASTDTYYLGMDVKTPSGLKTCTSMVQLYDNSFNIWPGKPHFREPKVRGEAIYCDLGDDKNLVALLSFEGDPYGLWTLRDLPWLAAGISPAKSQSVKGRHDLTGDLTPNLVSFTDNNDRYSMVQVSRNSIFSFYGKGFSIDRIWVEMTDDPYISGGLKQHLPWISDVLPKGKAAEPFKAIGLLNISTPLVMN